MTSWSVLMETEIRVEMFVVVVVAMVKGQVL